MIRLGVGVGYEKPDFEQFIVFILNNFTLNSNPWIKDILIIVNEKYQIIINIISNIMTS